MKTKTCEHCGGEIVRPPYKIANAYWKRKRFCCRECSAEGRRGERRPTFGKSRKTLVERFWSKVQKRGLGDCWLWSGASDGRGYGYLAGTRREPSIKAHRLSYEIHNGEIPKGMCVCHHCDNRLCVNPKHFFLGTRAENNADKEAKGRGNQPYGEKHGPAKLTYADVALVREMRAKGMTQQKIADHFGISQVAISALLRGKTWRK